MLPNNALSNFEIEKAVKDLGISKYRGTFMRDTLPSKPWKDECGIMNLDRSDGQGNHWLSWIKRGNVNVFFDSYGLAPPPEIAKYLGNNLFHNTTQVQSSGWLCGHYCLYVLAATNKSTESTSLRFTQDAINKLF